MNIHAGRRRNRRREKMETIYYCVYCGKSNKMEDLHQRPTNIKRTQSLCCECGKSNFEIIRRL